MSSSESPPADWKSSAAHHGVRLLASEIKATWNRGEPADATAALSRHPELQADRSAALDLAYQEYWHRTDAGEEVDVDTFCGRFPTFKTSLLKLIRMHAFLGLRPDLLLGEPTRWPEEGETFLEFELQRELGRGAFARVFLAAEPKLGGRPVALKVSQHGPREARTLGQLSHRNIVPVNSVQDDPETGLTAICMPYLGSATLLNVLDVAFARNRPPRSGRVILEAARDPLFENQPAQEAPHRLLRRGTYVEAVLHLVAQLADGLALIHARGVQHCDLKPSNVLVSPDGTPRLLDFNLAQGALGAEENLQGGTLPYMSPEQLGVSPAPLDGRSDLFSLGVMLFQLLAGSHPFDPVPARVTAEEFSRLLLRRQRGGPPSVRAANPDVPESLDRLVRRCLAFDPADRVPTAAALAADLRQELTALRRARLLPNDTPALGTGLPALTLETTPEPTRKPVPRRRRLRVAVGVLLALTLVGGGIAAAGWYWGQADARGWFERGRALQQEGDQTNERARFADAIVAYRQSQELAPSGETQACIAYCQFRCNETKLAIAEFEEAIKAGYRNARVYNDLGYIYLHGGELDKALRNLNLAIQADDRLQAAYLNRAVVYFRLAWQARFAPNQRAKVQTLVASGQNDITRALEIGPKGAEVYYEAAKLNAILAKEDQQALERGLDQLQRALEHGFDRKQAREEGAFQDFRTSPRFEEVLRTPAAAQAVHSPQMLDPVVRR
jgi:serine/threonine protein kinase